VSDSKSILAPVNPINHMYGDPVQPPPLSTTVHFAQLDPQDSQSGPPPLVKAKQYALTSLASPRPAAASTLTHDHAISII
jgi:hypothetical protein